MPSGRRSAEGGPLSAVTEAIYHGPGACALIVLTFVVNSHRWDVRLDHVAIAGGPLQRLARGALPCAAVGLHFRTIAERGAQPTLASSTVC